MAHFEFDNSGNLGTSVGDISFLVAGTTSDLFLVNESSSSIYVDSISYDSTITRTIPAGGITDITLVDPSVITVSVAIANLAIGDILSVTGVATATNLNRAYTVVAISADGLMITTDFDGTVITGTPDFTVAGGTVPVDAPTTTADIDLWIGKAQRYDGHRVAPVELTRGSTVFTQVVVPAGVGNISAIELNLASPAGHGTGSTTGERVYVVSRD